MIIINCIAFYWNTVTDITVKYIIESDEVLTLKPSLIITIVVTVTISS